MDSTAIDANLVKYAFQFALIFSDIKTTTQFVTEPEGLVKVVTKSKIHRRNDRISRTAADRKTRMCDLKKEKVQAETSRGRMLL